jgi:HSP20 family protein
MKLVKYHPHGLFDGLFDNWNRGLFPASPVESPEVVQRRPRTNIEESDGAYVLTMEMPGLSKKDVEVSLEKDTLTVRGERVVDKEEKSEAGYLRREISSTKFERSFSIGKEVDQENIKAKMEDGILTVTLSKSAERVGRKVDVA